MGNCAYAKEGAKIACACVSVIKMCVRIDEAPANRLAYARARLVTSEMDHLVLHFKTDKVTHSLPPTYRDL